MHRDPTEFRKRVAARKRGVPITELYDRGIPKTLPAYDDGTTPGDPPQLTPWPALNNIEYIAVPDTAFTREKTGAGSIEVMFKDTPKEGYTYGTGYKYPHPKPGHNVIIYNPKENDAQDVRLDALHLMPQDPTYDVLRSELAYYADDSDIAYNARNRMNEDIAKYGHPIPGMKYQDYYSNEVDGFLRNMFIEGTPEYIESKRYYPDKQQLREWNKHLMPYVDKIYDYLTTNKRPANVLPEVTIEAPRKKSPKRYDDGKTPEETYYGKHLPIVTIEGHKPTLWENIGNWFVDASKRAVFNENPAVMTASGWTPYSDGSTRQDAFNTPERNDLANKLVDIGVSGATDVWGGPLAGWALGKVWNKLKPPFKITQKNAHKITDAQWDDAYMKAVNNNDLKEAQRLRDLHFKAKASKTKVVDETGMPKKTYHTVQDSYDPHFNEFDPNIEGTHSAIYASDNPIMSGTYTSKPVSQAEVDYYAEQMRLNELHNIEAGRVPKSLAEIRKGILSDPERGRAYIIRNSFLNQQIEAARQKQLYLNLENPLIVDNAGGNWNSIHTSLLPDDVYSHMKLDAVNGPYGFGAFTTRSLERAQKAVGRYDGAIIDNVTDFGSSIKSTTLKFEPSTVYQINDPTKLKLADPITYDNAGSIIPLSKRDNFNIKDIRYVLPWIFGGSAIKYYNK